MKYVVYISTAVQLFTDEQLTTLLQTSRANNSALAVTGLLLYHEGAIFQILEGNDYIIDDLYVKIMGDTRHRGGLKMFEGYGDKRYFSEWSMAFRKLNVAEWNEVEGFISPDKLAGNFSKLKDPTAEIMSLLQSFMHANFHTILPR
jgi:hypothetical protein